MRFRRGDLSGPVLAILVTLVLLAIGATIIAYFTLFAGGTAQPVFSILGQPVAYKAGADAVVNVTIVNVGATTIPGVTKVYLNATGTTVSTTLSVDLTPGKSVTLSFTLTGKWSAIKDLDYFGAVLTVENVGSMTINVRVLRTG